ncbi:MAG: diaminopimelate epimerase [Lachnospiraceae bacterium]|nr:diaminopimelate epimerase [Lachnospiraceae bacterium]
MHFTKMQGLGNDYVYIDCLKEQVDDPGALARKISDRHFGIGSDGLILIKDSAEADFTMEMYNADGSRSEMCGNGIRCVGKYVYDNGLTDKTDVSVETLAGIKYLHLFVEKASESDRGFVKQVEVNMGSPVLKPEQIPVDIEKLHFYHEGMEQDLSRMVCYYPVLIAGKIYPITCVSMGNPHCVTFVEQVADFPIDEVGKVFESHEIFPRRVNAEFAEIVSRDFIRMRVYERGTGETFACGTGTCATVVAAVLNELTEEEVTVELLGGRLHIRWDRAADLVYMTGPAETVYKGVIEV